MAVVLSGCNFLPAAAPADQARDGGSPELVADGAADLAPAAVSYVDISVADAKVWLEQHPEVIVIDVSPNYAAGHLPGAVNYYVGDGSLDRAIPALDKDETYLVYCHVDSAAILGAQKLIDAGFKNVYRLEGNYSSWVAAGYPVEK